MVLTLDDAVKSHRTFVAPLLKELGFRATFFVTHRWMSDQENFMTWQEIAELHQMGFEIGNHTWTHGSFSSPRNAAHLHGELALVEGELKKVGVPRPSTFAYPGDDFGPEAVKCFGEARLPPGAARDATGGEVRRHGTRSRLRPRAPPSLADSHGW